MALPASKYFTPEEYLEIEHSADHKSEYYDGQIYAMAGGSKRHNLIGSNIIRELGTKLKSKPCHVFNSDQKIFVNDYELYTYPDASVVCGPMSFDAPDPDIVTNPILIVEVLSESTAGYDRGKKFEFYRSITTFREYLLVDQDRVYIEHFHQDPANKWILTVYNKSEDTLSLPSLAIDLSVAEIYDKISWPEKQKSLEKGDS